MKQGMHILFYSDELASFQYSATHPFKPGRARQLMDLLNRYALMYEPNQKILKPEPLDEKLLLLFHERRYIDLLKKCNSGEFSLEMLEAGIGNPDNPVMPGMLDFALKASGGTWQGVMMLLNGEARFVFNPLGGFHHAGRNYAEGFCYINDIAIAIQECVNRGKKVAYIDIDAHHGNGVQDAFYASDKVLTISLHESGKTLYPWSGFEDETGIKEGEGYNVNIPFMENTDDEVYLHAFRELVPPLLERFNADLIFVEVGGDAHREDPLAHLSLTSNAYREIIQTINGLSDRIIATGGGGYNVFKTASLWALAWSLFCDIEPEDNFAGSVGGMMFGPEAHSGSLNDPPFTVTGGTKEQCMDHARKVAAFLKENIPLLKS